MANRDDLVPRLGETDRHRAAEPAQTTGDDCDSPIHEIPPAERAPSRNVVSGPSQDAAEEWSIMPPGTIFAFNPLSREALQKGKMMTRAIVPSVFTAGLLLALAACTNPYDPGQRAVGGGLLGAGAGAAIGGAAGGGRGAAIGAAVGGATGAVTGAATTPAPPPPPPPSGYGYGPGYGYPPPPAPSGYGYPPPPQPYPSY